jgi:hypothetical protein
LTEQNEYPEAVKALVENLDVVSEMAKYLSVVVDQIARSLAVIYLTRNKQTLERGKPLKCGENRRGRNGNDSENRKKEEA